ncbi:daptide-type RiPP biosynthesis methyltransferase [Streptomyces sp. ISL-1]|uniref:daptide-type RiPP biosynthesis methyltransferase n=1 Tax=Streptomyces sp. ISL-1 TaxID=2817657 RepID=UPI0027E5934D|nr:daptide-type RiPP biosynthesis methyltransferase [Streptomyces sp. ISL-1]
MAVALTPLSIPGRAGQLVSQLGDRAELHDVYDETGSRVYHDVSVRDTHEVRELVALVRRIPGAVLELAAGSGRLTMPLLALGREVTAVELSAAMLELLSERLAEAPERLRERCVPVQADMSSFALGRRFEVIVLGTTSISLLDEEGRAGLYAAVREHLAPGGRFLLSTVDIVTPDDPEAAEAVPEAVIAAVGAGGRAYRMHDYWPAGADTRTVTIFPAEIGDEGPVTVCTTTVGVLPVDQLGAELGRAGLTVLSGHPLPGAWRYRDVLLEVGVTA